MSPACVIGRIVVNFHGRNQKMLKAYEIRLSSPSHPLFILLFGV